MGACRVTSAPARSLGRVGQPAEPGPAPATRPRALGLVCRSAGSVWKTVWLARCPGRGRRACARASQRGRPLWCHLSPHARGQGGQRRLPGMCSVSWGWVRLPAFPPSGDLAFLAAVSRCALGLWTASPTHPLPSPSQGPGACQVVRLPVTHLGSSSCLPGKAAEQLGGRGEAAPWLRFSSSTAEHP